MRVHRILLKTRAEGPGTRICIWVQGCSHRCKGCFAKELWDPEKGREMSVSEIEAFIQPALTKVDGITFLGGEPMDQAAELWPIAKRVKEAGKTVITFTGYLYEKLQELPNYGDVNQLLKYTDVLADGPFIEELISYDRPLLGSSNQRFIFLTDAIGQSEMMQYKNSFEVRIRPNGQLQINGMGDLKQLEKYLERIGKGASEITNI